jgi:NIMA (never in mitosis gene a)-related kinase
MENYFELRVVGKGSYGVVKLVRRSEGNLLCVMKTVTPANFDQVDETELKKAQAESLKEVSVLSKLAHPSIVAFIEAFFSPTSELCIVMEYCDSGDMGELITKAKTKGQVFSQERILDYLSQIALALSYLHERHILHRDLKPENIFLHNRNRIVKLGDFGITKTLASTASFAETRIGTPYVEGRANSDCSITLALAVA